MGKRITNLLTITLMVISAVSFINIAIMYWLPVNLQLISFTCVRLTVVALIEKNCVLFIISVIICALIFLCALSIRKKNIILPMISLFYFLIDFAVVLALFIDGMDDYGYWKTYIVHIVIYFMCIALLTIYCLNWFKKNQSKHKTGDGSSVLTD